MDLGSSRARQRRSDNAYDEYSEYSDGEGYGEYQDPRGGYNRQVLLKEKEDLLLERALERIARARALGKTNVKLSQAEIDALERAERRQRPPPPPLPAPAPAPKPAAKGKKAASAKSRVVERKRSSNKSTNNSPKMKAIEPAKRGRSTTASQEAALVPYPIVPEEHYGPSDGALMHAPQGYYGSPAPAIRPGLGSSRPASRTASSHSLRQVPQTPQPLAYHQHPYFQGRYYSNPDTLHENRPSSNSSRASRPDPSEPDWEPRARSTSSLLNYPIDQLPNPTQTSRAPRFDPNDPRFASPTARRVVSGPASTYPQQMYRRQSGELFLPPGSPNYPTPYETTSEERTTSEDDDEYNQGVQVEVLERSEDEYAIQTRSIAAAKAPGKGRPGQARKKGR